jgi:hypothetical protein
MHHSDYHDAFLSETSLHLLLKTVIKTPSVFSAALASKVGQI